MKKTIFIIGKRYYWQTTGRDFKSGILFVSTPCMRQYKDTVIYKADCTKPLECTPTRRYSTSTEYPSFEEAVGREIDRLQTFYKSFK